MQTAYLFVILAFLSSILAIYLPENDFKYLTKVSEKTTETEEGPKIEKIQINSRANLALTTVLIMGSAGMTVVYVLCIFILCVR